MARTLPNSKLNPSAFNADEAYNRAVNRGEFLTQSALDPQPAPTNKQAHPDRLEDDHAGEG
jgi:hypothetical protein